MEFELLFVGYSSGLFFLRSVFVLRLIGVSSSTLHIPRYHDTIGDDTDIWTVRPYVTYNLFEIFFQDVAVGKVVFHFLAVYHSNLVHQM